MGPGPRGGEPCLPLGAAARSPAPLPHLAATSCLLSRGQAGFVSPVAFYKGWQAGRAVGGFLMS